MKEKQFLNCNATTQETEDFILFKSYDTPIIIIDKKSYTAYISKLGYSQTTWQHIYKFLDSDIMRDNVNFVLLIEVKDFKKRVEKTFGLHPYARLNYVSELTKSDIKDFDRISKNFRLSYSFIHSI